MKFGQPGGRRKEEGEEKGGKERGRKGRGGEWSGGNPRVYL